MRIQKHSRRNERPDRDTRSNLDGSLAIIAGVVANIAGILGNIPKIADSVHHVLGDAFHWIQPTLHFGVYAGVIVAYVLGFSWIYRKYARDMQRAGKIVFGVCCAIALAMLAIYNLRLSATPRMPAEEAQKQDSAGWIAQLMKSSRLPNGGLATAGHIIEPQYSTPWTTAQIVVGALLQKDRGKMYTDEIEGALGYLESTRIRAAAPACPCQMAGDPEAVAPDPREGWGYMEQMPWGVSEIAAWVILAHTYSLENQLQFKALDAKEIRTRVERDVTLLLERQTRAGGWGPIRERGNESFTRTYSTIMAVWALLEARRAVGPGKASDEAIAKGIQWLLAKYDKNAGTWFPNPNRQHQTETYDGLTAQALFVLNLAKDTDAFGILIDNDERYRSAVAALLRPKGLDTRPMNSNLRTHDSDRYLYPTIFLAEGTTFLWYPWALITASQLAVDSSLDEPARASAKALAASLRFRQPAFKEFAEQDFNYVRAEGLIAIGLSLNSSANE